MMCTGISKKHLGLMAGVIGSTAVISLAGAAQGAVLADYDFDTGRQSADSDLQSTATDISDGAGIADSSFNATEGDPAPSLELPRGSGGDDAIDGDQYETFEVEPVSGGTINFDQISYGVSAFAPETGSFGDDTFARWSVDNFGSNIAFAGTSTGDAGRDANGFETVTGDLSSSAAQSGPVEFRVYLDGLGGSASKGFRLDNVQVSGESSVVPEPASLALLGVGGLMMLGQRRRKA